MSVQYCKVCGKLKCIACDSPLVEKRREAGRKGGRMIAQRPGHMAAIGRLGGIKVSRNPDHMAALGMKGAAKMIEARRTLKAK